MDIKDVKVGLKVVPHNKSVGNISYKNSLWNTQLRFTQDYLVITDQHHTDVWGLCKGPEKDDTRQEYSSEDFDLYEEE